MLFSKKGTVITTRGTFRGPAGETLDLQEATDELAKCCPGVSCCENALFLRDTETDERYKIQVTGGALVVTPEDIAPTT